MEKLTTGPFLIPSRTSSGNPITHLFISLTNLSIRTLTVTLQIHQGFPVSDPNGSTFSTSSMTVLVPNDPITLAPSSGVMLAQNIERTTTTTDTATTDTASTDITATDTTTNEETSNSSNLQVLIVTVSGDVTKSGDLIQVSVTGGYSSDGRSLDDVEPMINFRHADLEVVHYGNRPLPPLHY